MVATDWTLSIVMIVPASQRETANRLSCALGHDVLPGDTFSVPLSPTGSTPPTHYGCRTAAQQTFVGTLTQAQSGALPQIPWGDFGLTVEDIQEILEVLILGIRPASTVEGQFEELLASKGLQIIQDSSDV